MSGSNENAPSTEPLVTAPKPRCCTCCTRAACGKLVLVALAALTLFLVWHPSPAPIPDNTRTFTIERATTFANLAGAAYCSDAALKAWSCGDKCIKGVEKVHVCHGDNTRAFVAKFEGKGVVSFAGSQDFHSMFQELLYNSSSVEFGNEYGCRLEKSVMQEWAALESCIEGALEAIGSPRGSKIKVVGHSVGGAVASVGMYAWMKAGFSAAGGWLVTEAYTFGSPKPGNEAFYEAFGGHFGGAASAFYRVTYHLDPFPHLPLDGDDVFTQLAPEAFFATDFTNYRMCADPESSKCSQQYGDMAINWTNHVDHLVYMGVNTSALDCDGQEVVETSKIVV